MDILGTNLVPIIDLGGQTVGKASVDQIRDFVTPYRVLIARLNEPTSLTIFENTLGFTPTVLNSITGYFYIQHTGGFPKAKTWICCTWGATDSDQGNTMNAYVAANNNQIEIQIRTPQVSQNWIWDGINGEIEDLFIEIRVYP